jgi:hypothetical protein
MYIKCKERDIRTFISRHILHQCWYTCPTALPVRLNPQHRSLLTVVSATSAPLRHQRNVCHPVVNCFTRHTLPTINRKHLCINILCIESFHPQNMHNITLLFGRIHLKHGRQFDYWNQSLNMHMRVCYLDCHEVGLCFCLVVHAENLLRQLQLPFVTYLLTLLRILVENDWVLAPEVKLYNVRCAVYYIREVYRFCTICILHHLLREHVSRLLDWFEGSIKVTDKEINRL